MQNKSFAKCGKNVLVFYVTCNKRLKMFYAKTYITKMLQNIFANVQHVDHHVEDRW